MMAATLIAGRTEIHNAATEPEIGDLAVSLNAMGAKVSGAGTERVTIDGVQKLRVATHRSSPTGLKPAPI